MRQALATLSLALLAACSSANYIDRWEAELNDAGCVFVGTPAERRQVEVLMTDEASYRALLVEALGSCDDDGTVRRAP